MSIIDNKLLVDENAFIDYMSKELRDFQARMGLREKDRYCTNIGSNDFPLYVSENEEGLYIVVDHARVVGYRYDDWFKHENSGDNTVLTLLKEKGLERIVYYARCIVSFYKDIDKDVENTEFNYLRNEAKRILYVYLHYNTPHQMPHDVTKKQVADIVKRLDDIRGGGYSLSEQYCNKQTSRLRLPLRTLDTEHQEYYFILKCISTESECKLIQEHLERKYDFKCGSVPLVEVACLLASCSVLKAIMKARVAVFNMLPDEEKAKMPLVEYVAVIEALDSIMPIITQHDSDPLHDYIMEAYQMCLDFGMFKYRYSIDYIAK